MDLNEATLLTCSSVISYASASASLQLGHAFPKGTDISVLVDVEMLLPTLNSEATRVGEWVNVIGYVKPRPKASSKSRSTEKPMVLVQALMIWPTGPLDVQRYERSLADPGTDTQDGQ